MVQIKIYNIMTNNINMYYSLSTFQNYRNVKATNYYFKQPFHRRVMKYS